MNDEEYFEQLCSNSVDGTLTVIKDIGLKAP